MSAKEPSTLAALTGIRFWAALMVVLFHFGNSGIPNHNYYINSLIARGSMGVDLFFILSGYIIHHVYSLKFAESFSRQAYIKFIGYRVARMYPVHVFTMGLMYALYVTAIVLFKKLPPDNDSYQWGAAAANLLMLHAWLGIGSPNIPAWSISAEWFMYLLYPLVAMALFRFKPMLEWLLLIACVITIHTLVQPTPLLHIVPEFMFGATLYQLNRQYRFSAKFSPFSGLFLIVFFAFSLYLPIEDIAIYDLIFDLLIISLTSDKDRIGKLLATSYATYLGEISYSLYMIHSFVWSLTKNAMRQLLPDYDFYSPEVIIIAVLTSVISASLVYHTVEVPGRRLIRRLTSAKDFMAVV